MGDLVYINDAPSAVRKMEAQNRKDDAYAYFMLKETERILDILRQTDEEE